MTIALTGATGFVGKNLSPCLAGKGFNVEAVGRKGEGLDLEPLKSKTFDAVIHLAGKAHDLKKTADEGEYFRVNTGLTKEVFDAFLASSASVFIFMSSVKAAADRVKGELSEEHVPDPQTPYGKSKLAAENYILSKPLSSGKRVYILRPAMIHGPGNKGNLNLLYKIVSKGVPWPLGAFENERSFCSIDNLLFIIHQLVTRPEIPTGIYHVADDEAVSTNTLISLIGKSVNKQPRTWRLPKPLVNALARLGDAVKLPLNSERLQKLTESYVVSNEKIKGAIGKNLPVPAREGLMKTLQSFQP